MSVSKVFDVLNRGLVWPRRNLSKAKGRESVQSAFIHGKRPWFASPWRASFLQATITVPIKKPSTVSKITPPR